MRITYVKLENVAGLYVGGDRKALEINFNKSKNEIISIIGQNGIGKTTLLSSLSPFAYVTSLDDRSSLPYIKIGENGYKEIHYQSGEDEYIIKHYFKANKDTHIVKSYFIKNGEELNENGNVTSFNSLIEIHFGLTQELMRLIRIGTNVNSFVTLSPAKRKEYIGKLIEEIDLYLKIYNKINADIRVVKTLIQTNASNLYKCHISDIEVENEKLKSLASDIKEYENKRDTLISKIGKLDQLIRSNNIDELRRKQQEAIISLKEFDDILHSIQKVNLQDTTIDQLINKRNSLSEQKIDIQSKINSSRLMMDTTLHNIERLELSVKKITSNNDLQSLVTSIESLRDIIDHTPEMIKTFIPVGSTSDEVFGILSKLRSFNQISSMIYTLGNKPIDIYIKLINEGKSVDQWLQKQAKNSINRMNSVDIKSLIDQVFGNDDIISPNCSTEYAECPYYRLSETINQIHDKLEEESIDDETLHYIQIIANNIDNIFNELDGMRNIKIPERIKDTFTEYSILGKLKNRLQFFDLSSLEEYLSMLKDYEIYKINSQKLHDYEYQLSIYRKSGIDSQVEEINRLQTMIDGYKSDISKYQNDITEVNNKLSEVDDHITLVTKYNDSKKYRKIFEATLESTTKTLEPLENADQERRELEFSLRNVTNQIEILRVQHRDLENKITEYNRLVNEGLTLAAKNKDLNMILEATSTKKGIPVIYMNQYLTKIRNTANELLSLIYDDFKLSKFVVTPETFEVPYKKNGMKIPDIKYASQSELALATMALSFALANRATGIYNILLLDEIDAGLDDANRGAFLKMLRMQMNTLHAEQVFIISHNMSQMANIPMDCIKLSDTPTNKLQNIIYE